MNISLNNDLMKLPRTLSDRIAITFFRNISNDGSRLTRFPENSVNAEFPRIFSSTNFTFVRSAIVSLILTNSRDVFRMD